ncbi:MAG: hypothetical protein NXH75_15410 [Halobacteriovoraceae bacterium]|jgi:hypothetical protein|nr:hypothetical protein [Halobacteriovoraceae bacterium]
MEQRTSSVVDKNVQNIRNEQPAMSTWFLLVSLVVALVVLKAFIYIKDGDRHGK